MGDVIHLEWARRLRQGGTSWRPYSEDFWWQQYDAVIASERAPRPSYDVYTYGHWVAARPSLREARDYVEDVYGPQDWRIVRLPPVKVEHPLGPTNEFTDPRSIWVIDVLPLLGKAASNRVVLRKAGD